MKKVLVLPSSFGKFSQRPKEILTEAGLEAVYYSKPGMTEDEVIDKLQGCDGVILGLEPMTARVMDACKSLKCVVRFGVGMDNVDQAAAKERGIKLGNTPGANADAVADCAFGMMLSLARSIHTADRDLKSGQWNKYTGYPVYGAVLGVIGLGAIGKGMALRAKGFGMRVMAYDIYWDEKFISEHGIEKASLEDIYHQADFITLHTALTQETRNMIGREQLQQMKPNAILINCARGGLVDEDALYQALSEKKIAGAGIDAFATEPPFGSPLLTLDNVVASPHIAGSSIGAIDNMGTMAAQKCVELLRD